MTTQKKTGRPTGATGQAKVLDDKELKRVLSVVESGNHAKRNAAIVILSNYLGLRSKELAALKIGDVIEHDTIKKVLRLVAAYRLFLPIPSKGTIFSISNILSY